MDTALRFYLTVGVAALTLAACGKDDAAQRQKQADDLAQGIETYLATVEAPPQSPGLHHGKVTVVSAEAGDYLVTIGGVNFGAPAGARLEIGDVAYHLAPKDNGDYTASRLSLAPEMPIVGEDGKPAGAVKLEPGDFQAIWSKAYNTFLSLDWQAKNLALHKDGADGGDATAQALSVKLDGTDKGKGILDQSSSLVVDGLSVADSAGTGKFTIAKLTGTGAMTGLNVAAYQAAVSQFRQVAQKIAAATEAQRKATPQAPVAVSEDDRKTITALVGQLPKLMSGLGYSVKAEGIASSEANGTDMFQLAHAGLDIAVKNLNTDKSALDFAVSHDGLKLRGEAGDPVTKAMLPRSGNLALSLIDIPTPTLVDAIAQSLPSLMTGDESTMQSGMFMLTGSMTSLLQQSQLKLKISPSGLATDQAHLTVQGDLKVAPQSPYLATGTLDGAITGLDELVATLSSLPAAQPDLAQALGMLQALKGFAKRETGSDGKPVDKYKFDLTPEGQLLVNGKPIEGL